MDRDHAGSHIAEVIPLFELNSSALSLQDDDLQRLLGIARAEFTAGRSIRLSAHHPLTDEVAWAVNLMLDAEDLLVVLDGLAEVLGGVAPVIRAARAVTQQASAEALSTLNAAVQELPTPQAAGWP